MLLQMFRSSITFKIQIFKVLENFEDTLTISRHLAIWCKCQEISFIQTSKIPNYACQMIAAI